MSRLLRRSLVALVALSTLAVAAGCGNSETSEVTTAETEGIYLDLGGMKYQIQMSRYLNPSDTQDRDYLHGLPTGVTAGKGNLWFGIWMRVENSSNKPLPVATDYTITDTQKAVYRPVPLDAKANPFAYQAGPVAPQSTLPAPDSAGWNTPVQGSLILFRINVDSLQNRPLILHITQGGKTDTATIDV
jgi:hypothetical protein